jgi:putative oxidoreductase
VTQGVGVLLVVSGALKTANPHEFLEVVLRYDVLPPLGATGIAMSLPWIEVVVVGALLFGRVAVPAALLSAAALGIAFLIAQASVMIRGINVPCGCLGASLSGEDAVGPWTFSRAALLTFAAGALLWRERRRALACTSAYGDRRESIERE